MRKPNRLEGTRARLAELQQELAGVELLLEAAETSLESAFADATAYSKAASVVATLEAKKAVLTSAYELGKRLERQQIAQDELAFAADLERKQQALEAKLRTLVKERELLRQEERKLSTEIDQLSNRAGDFGSHVTQLRRENREYA